MRFGAGEEIRTPDQRLGKPMRYHCATPARSCRREFILGGVRNASQANGIERVWVVLKQSLLGVYHCGRVKHLSRYLNEATCRLHEGNCQIDTIDRLRALGQGMEGTDVSAVGQRRSFINSSLICSLIICNLEGFLYSARSLSLARRLACTSELLSVSSERSLNGFMMISW